MTVPDCTALYLMKYACDEEIPLMGMHHSNLPEYLNHYPGLGWLQHILGQYFCHSYYYLQSLYYTTPYMHKYLMDTYKFDKVTELGHLHNENISFRVLVIGTRPRKDVVKHLPNTTCIGWLNGYELVVAYALTNIFLFPSAMETFGNVTLEAAASGLPLVVEEEYVLNSRQASCQYEQKTIVQQMLANYTKVYDDFYSKYEGHH
eukprot:14571084-Ditylum_brightwellii.AAC.1